jgi:CubicO group peptidase (beta-lactamase class C family)
MKSISLLAVCLLAAGSFGSAHTACQSDQQADPIFPGAEEQGFDIGLLAEAYSEAARVEGMKSLLVARNGELVAEAYYNGHGPDRLHDVRSVTKSVTSALVGIAIDRGFIESVEQPIGPFIEPLVTNLDADRANITIHQLLTMTSGLEWHELGGESEFSRWMSSPDQLEYILAKPFVNPPGTRFDYSDGGAHLLSVVLTEATGQSALDFAQQYLFTPLGIGTRQWLADNRGYNVGGAGLAITSRDMLRIGMLYLDLGADAGEQVVPADWVSTSTSSFVTTGMAVPYGPYYGYLWWSGSAHGRDFYFATGYGGQFILNVPELNLVVVATCEWRYPIQQSNSHWYDIISVMVNQVLPAVRSS